MCVNLFTHQNLNNSTLRSGSWAGAISLVCLFVCSFVLYYLFIYFDLPPLKSSILLSILLLSSAAIKFTAIHIPITFVSHEWNQIGHSHFITTTPRYIYEWMIDVSSNSNKKKCHSFLFLPLLYILCNMVHSSLMVFFLLNCNWLSSKPPHRDFLLLS